MGARRPMLAHPGANRRESQHYPAILPSTDADIDTLGNGTMQEKANQPANPLRQERRPRRDPQPPCGTQSYGYWKDFRVTISSPPGDCCDNPVVIGGGRFGVCRL